MKASLTLRAPAKLNLALEILRPQAGGLHGLRSVMVPLDLYDEIHIAPDPKRFVFSCDDPALQDGNLVERAFRALGLNAGARVELRKRIPTGAGMGGGSSDAAAILLAAQRGELGVTPRLDYLQTALQLGSDVPFFMVETAALVEGTGERVTALGRPPAWHAVIIKPPVTVSTAKAYSELDERERTVRPRNDSIALQLAQALQRAQYDRVVDLLHNDFLDVMSSRPEIAQALEMLRAAGARKPMLTGSGSSVFALAQTAHDRDTIAVQLQTVPGQRVFACAFWSAEGWRGAP